MFAPGHNAGMLSGLNERQREAVEWMDTPLMVLAGAGTGKTRTLTAKIAWLLDQEQDQRKAFAPNEIMAVTFTNKAAREMRERVERLVGPQARGMLVSTFHSACVRFLRQEAERINLDPNFTIYDDSDQKKILDGVLEELMVQDSRISVATCSGFISHVKNQLLDPDTVAADRYHLPRLADVFHKYQMALHLRNGLDFDDLLLRVVSFLTYNPDILKEFRDRFHYLLVDEFQDTNPVQYRLVHLLMGGRNNLFVVGDDDQSIYSWRGANVDHMFRFDEDFPGTRLVRLEQNYRSTPQILNAANAVIAKNSRRKGKTLWTEKPSSAPVQLKVYRDDRHEGTGLTAQVRVHQDDGLSLEDMAVLYRTNAMSRVLEESLRRADIPYRILGGVGFYQRKEIKDLMAYLRLLVNPMDLVAFGRILNTPRRGIGATGLAKIESLAKESNTSPMAFSPEQLASLGPTGKKLAPFVQAMSALNEQKDTLTPLELIETLLRDTGYEAMLVQERTEEANQRLDNLAEFQRVVEEQMEEDEDLTLGQLMDSLSLYTDMDQRQEGQKLTLMTLHSAKGLEYPVVFLPGLEEGLMPHSRSLGDENALEEERRLMYVGMTRARKHLHLSYAQSRFVYNRSQPGIASRFLSEIPKEQLVVEEAAPPPGSPGQLHNPWGGGGSRGGGRQWPLAGGRAGAGKRSDTDATGARVVKSLRAQSPEISTPRSRHLGVPPGTRVSHPVLGLGTVLAVMDDRVQVDFDDGNDRWLAWEFAQLSVAQENARD